MKVASILLFALAGSIASAQPSVDVAPIPTPTVPGGNDIRGNPFLAPGPFPATVQATKIDLFTFPGGGVLDGANSNYVRIAGIPLGQPMSGATNEGDMDVNMSLNPLLLNPSEPRAAFAFPNTNWDSVLPGQQASFSVATGGEPAYGWAATTGAGVLWAQVSDNGRDNGFTAFGSPTGTLYAHAQGATGSFRGGPGYNMLTGNFSNGNGTIFASIHALGFATEYVIDIAYAWFPFQQGWVAGSTTGSVDSAVFWVANTNAPDPQGGNVNWPSRGPALPDDASEIVTLAGTGFAEGSIGFTTTDLDITPATAMLFIQSGADTNDAYLPGLVENGSEWNFAFRRDAFSPDFPEEAEFATASNANLTFVALPYTTRGLQGGKVTAAGAFAMDAADNNTLISKAGTGTYELQVLDAAGRGVAIEGGMLMLQSLLAQDGDPTDPNRNVLSYEFDENRGVYVIQSRIMQRDDNNGNVFLESYPLIDSPFYVAFVNFDGSLGAGGCNAADLAEPFGSLNFFDVSAFLAAYNAQSPAADLAAPFGTFNFFDVSTFLGVYNAGCP